MTPTPDTPTRAFSIIREVLATPTTATADTIGDKTASRIEQRLAAAGLLVATPTEEAQFYGACGELRCTECRPLFDQNNEEIPGTYVPPGAALTAAAGFAPQRDHITMTTSDIGGVDLEVGIELTEDGEPSVQIVSREGTSGIFEVVLNDDTELWSGRAPQASRDTPSLAENDREKLIAEAEDWLANGSPSGPRRIIRSLVAALAAVPDETELAEVLRSEIAKGAYEQHPNEKPYESSARRVARAVREWWEKKR